MCVVSKDLLDDSIKEGHGGRDELFRARLSMFLNCCGMSSIQVLPKSLLNLSIVGHISREPHGSVPLM